MLRKSKSKSKTPDQTTQDSRMPVGLFASFSSFILVFVMLNLSITQSIAAESSAPVVSGRWSLTGKNIVVTGGSKGIGLAIIKECCALGAKVLTCSRNAGDLNDCIEKLHADGYENVDGVVADVSTAEGREILVQECKQRFLKIDCLINNVGSNIRKPMIEYTASEYDIITRTNLESAFFLSQALYPSLKAAGKASVVNIGSVAGGCATSIRSGTVYAMTKAAMCQMTANLACEWALDKIRVNVVSPWYIRTELAEQVLSKPEYLKSVLDRTPIKRIGLVEEVSSIVAFLCMDCASYITGQNIAVDGAFTRNGFY